MIGDRIKRARLAAGLTQVEVVNLLSSFGITLTKAGLSKYELGGSVPSAKVVLTLARVLRVRVKALLEESSVQIEWLSFRKNVTLGIRNQDRIKAIVCDIVEKQVVLQETLYGVASHAFPQRSKANCADDAESTAANLRKSWALGDLPLASITEVIEDNGGIAVHVPNELSNFHGLSGWANNKYPIAITASNAALDRTRFNLAHELGHLLMDSDELPDKEAENLAHRFAGAFIVPAQVARRELGDRRRDISFSELASLKKKYGLSMQAWVYRAKDLDIIGSGHATALWKGMSARGWKKKEPVEFEGKEEPKKLLQMTLRALSQGIISENEAHHLCPNYQQETEQLFKTTIRPGVTPLEVLKMSPEQRALILSESSKLMENEYLHNKELTEFDALDADSFEDEIDE